jgi:hypothetical protein
MNVHTPERQANESQADYRARQARSAAAVKVMTKGPTQAAYIPLPGMPPPNWVLWWAGQHTNTARANRRKAIAAFGGVRQFKKAKRRSA